MATTHTNTIETADLDHVRGKIAKLNKRAAKLGLPPFALELGETSIITRRSEATGRKYKVELVAVSITCPPIRFGGYTFCARLDSIEGRTVVMAAPGQDVPERYRGAIVDRCDHCNTVRRRKNYYLLHDNAGTYLQVGSSCIKDFLGHDADAALRGFTLSDNFWEEGMGGRSVPMHDMRTVMAHAASSIRQAGWVSRKLANESYETEHPKRATADAVAYYLSRPLPPKAKPLEIIEKDRRLAAQALAWVKLLSCNGDNLSEYESNLIAVCCAKAIPNKFLGIACSLIPAAMRALGIESERKAPLVSAYIGAIGERRRFEGRFLGLSSFQGNFGPVHFFRVATAEGVVVVKSSTTWWADADIEKDANVSFIATIKKHGEYKGRLETTVNRAK